MLNKQIYSSGIVLLTGAGASAPLGLWTMADFLESVTRDIDAGHKAFRALEFLRVYRPASTGNLEALIDAERELDLFVRMSDALSQFDGASSAPSRGEGDPNVVQAFAAYLRDGRVENMIAARAAADMYLRMSAIPLAESAAALRQYLRSSVIQRFSRVDPVTTVSLYRPLWASLTEFCGRSRYIPFFTTNYDWAPETFAAADKVGVVDGFEAWGTSYRWKRDAYSAPLNRRNNPNPEMALFKLHGSTNWYRAKEGVIEKHQIGLRIDGLENMVIFPGLTKTESLEEPYQTSYQYLGAALRSARLLIVVGYRFADRSIQRLIESAIAEGSPFRMAVINGPGFRWDETEVSSEVVGRATLIPELFAASDDARPAYLTELRRMLNEHATRRAARGRG